MHAAIILTVSILFQLGAAFLALRLIWVTERVKSWALISMAILLMIIRRCIPLFHLLSGHVSNPPDPAMEIVALATSVLMFTGIALITPLFRSLRQVAEELKKHRDYLLEEVRERTGKLEKSAEQLRLEMRERKRSEYEKKDLLHRIEERLKELKLLHNLSRLLNKPNISLEELFQRAAHLLPLGWKYPEAACARIIFANREYRSADFETSRWGQSADIMVDGEKTGTIEVYYPEEKPEAGGGPFLQDERYLLEMISERLGNAANRFQDEQRQKLVAEILQVLNQPGKKTDLVGDILNTIKKFSGFEAVGIRLQEGDDFPYYVTRGFPAAFLEAKKYPCVRDQSGEPLRDAQGNPVFKCMCSYVICGRTDPALPYFTHGGSFWTNSTTALLASAKEEERQSRTLNRCNSEGYESVALIPLHSGQKIVGLLQLNDSRKNMLTRSLIDFFEKFGSSIGIALERGRVEESLSASNKALARQAAKLEEANLELSQYAYAVSHDIRAPLRAIHNYTDFLLEDLQPNLTEERQTYLNGLDLAVREAETLTEDLLELSRISKQTQQAAAPVDLGSLFQTLLSSLDPEDTVKFVMADNWPSLTARPALVRQIFQNLITNAVKFNNSLEKRLEIGWRYVENGLYEFFVRDNGIGIDRRHQEKIFLPFERLHTSEEYEGTGIGLAIVRKAASVLYGSVRVESRPGEGSTFFITLPG